MSVVEIIQIITGCLGSVGFGVLFNIRGKRLVAAAAGGFLSWTLFVIFSRFIPNQVVNYFVVSLLTSLYSEVMARVLKTPTTTFTVTALVPLIPGGSLYYTMVSAMESNLETFLTRAVATLQLAAALALGIIVSATVIRLFYQLVRKGR